MKNFNFFVLVKSVLGSFILHYLKYLYFEQKLPIRTTHHTFLESRYFGVIKNPYYVLSPKGSQKNGISSWTKNITKTFHLINSNNLLGEFYPTNAPGF